jgi:hypothetical protein
MLGVASSLSLANFKKAFATTTKKVLELDGTGDYVDASTIASQISFQQGSVSVWVNLETTDGNEAFFSTCKDSGGDDKIELQYLTSDALFRAIYKSGGTTKKAVLARDNDVVEADGFNHLGMVYNTATDQISLFFNGTRIDPATQSAITIIDEETVGTFNRVHLGRAANGTGASSHHGKLGDMAIYGAALTDDQMTEIYNGGKTFDHNNGSAKTNLIAWYKFGTGIVDGIQDSASVIFNLKNTALGSELVENSDLSSHGTSESSSRLGTSFSIDNWTIEKNVNDSGNRTFTALDGGGVRCTINTQCTSTFHQRIYHNVSSDLTIGDFYVFRAVVLSSDGSDFRCVVQKLTSDVATTQTTHGATTTTVANVPRIVESVFRCTDNTNQMVHIFPQNTISAGGFFEVHSASLKKYTGGAAFGVADASLVSTALR